MTTATIKANLMHLNLGAELWYDAANVAAPMGRFAAKDIPAALDALGADEVRVEYRTRPEPEARERDRAKFTKRLAGLGPGWSVGGWSNKVVRGFVFPDVMVCTLTRRTGTWDA